MTNWKEYKLEDICLKITDGSHSSPKEVPDGTRIIATVKDMLEFDFNYSNCKKITEDEYHKLLQNDCKPKENDILFSKDGTIGKIIVFNGKVDLVILSSIAIIRPNPQKVNPSYLGYYLKSAPAQKDIIDNYRSGSVIPRVILKDFKRFPVSLPDLPTQTAIAEILSSLDDKIELNNKINQELENLAQTLFKQWFIDFEFPNANGAPYKSSGGEMVESELGVIPKGWEVERLGDHLYIKGRIGWKGLKKSEYLQEFEGYSIVNGSDFLNEQIDYNTCGWIPKDRYNDSPEIQLKQNDILITKDGTIGKLAFVNKVEHPTSVASGVFVVRADSTQVSTYFCWSFFKSPYFQNLVKSRIDGSVIPHLYQKDFVEMFIPLPPSNLLEAFENQAKSIFELVFENKEESKELSKLRDTLLPKLISGGLEVKSVKF